MSSLGVKEQELFNKRLESAQKWRELGLNPYGNGVTPKHLASEVHAQFGHLKPEDFEKLGADVPTFEVAGRVSLIRSFGKAAFVVLKDRSGQIQAHVKADVLAEKFEFFKQVDLGDFVFVAGTPFLSKTGELTLKATDFKPLTKALKQPPEKWHGVTDTEIRYRQRYLDLMSNDEVKEIFRRRIKLVRFIRNFLDSRDYLEVETPMLHSLISGATARPFTTHHNALNMPLYMRIAPELHLKRLVVGGFERVYEINRNFRNEGISTKHNPEFTMLEFYQAYATYEDLMNLTEQMISQAATHVTGNSDVTYQGTILNFGKAFRRVTMVDSICEKVSGLQPSDFKDVSKLATFALKKAEPKERAAIEKMNAGELMGLLFEQYVEETLVQPTFVTQFPVEVSPLARRNDKDPSVTDRFELFVAGREIANAFSELNDPIDQKGRFQAQVDAKSRGQQETMDFDEDYISALEHGLPPTAGEGIGIDRLAMLFCDAPSIRDVILFPLLKLQAQ